MLLLNTLLYGCVVLVTAGKLTLARLAGSWFPSPPSTPRGTLAWVLASQGDRHRDVPSGDSFNGITTTLSTTVSQHQDGVSQRVYQESATRQQ